MRKMWIGIALIFTMCSVFGCREDSGKPQAVSGGAIDAKQETDEVLEVIMPDESTVMGRLSIAGKKYVYTTAGWGFDDEMCICQTDFEGKSINEFTNKEMGTSEMDQVLYVGNDEIIYLFNDGTKTLWSISLKNVGKKDEKPDFKNMKPIISLPSDEGIDLVLCVTEEMVAGFFAGEYKEIDRRSGKERSIYPEKGKKFYNFSYPFISNAFDGELSNSIGSDLTEDGYVLLTTDATESKGTLYLHKIGTSMMKKVAEDVYPAQRLISGGGKFFYWGIASMPRDSETPFDGIWMCDIRTGQQQQLVSKEKIKTEIFSAGELFMDTKGRLYFETSKEDLCCYNRVFFSLSPDAPEDLKQEEEMTEKLADCQYIKTYFGDTLYFEDGDGEEEEDIYTYDLKSGKIKKLKNWSPFAEVGYIC